jgi:hypothetical protein
MPGHLFVRALQIRFIAIGASDADLRIVGHDDRGRGAVKLQRPDVTTEPVR